MKKTKSKISKMKKFRMETIIEFLKFHELTTTEREVAAFLHELLEKEMVNDEICLTREVDGSVIDMLSKEIADFKTAKLEEAFDMKLKMEESAPLGVK